MCHDRDRHRWLPTGHLPGVVAVAAVYCRGMELGGQDPEKPPQGWFVDPFGVHEQRWFSQGRTTALVRDGRAEAQDPPPDGPVPGPLVNVVAIRPSAHVSDDQLPAVGRHDHDRYAPDEIPEDRFDLVGPGGSAVLRCHHDGIDGYRSCPHRNDLRRRTRGVDPVHRPARPVLHGDR